VHNRAMPGSKGSSSATPAANTGHLPLTHSRILLGSKRTITRRRVVITFAAGTLAAPLVSFAQQQANNPVRIGFLPLGLPSNAYDQSQVEAFRQGLRDAGLVENRHFSIDIVWVTNEGGYAQAVNELVQRGAKILVPAGTSASVAAKRQTSTIPIVFITVGDPVGIGLAETLSRPGGNATGFSDVLWTLGLAIPQSVVLRADEVIQ